MHYYYIPISKVEGGIVMFCSWSGQDIKIKYEKKDVMPDPTRYYVKEFSSDYHQPKTGYHSRRSQNW